jgi:hypothetical protein
MKKLIIVLCCCFLMSAAPCVRSSAQVYVRHGITAGAGAGWFRGIESDLPAGSFVGVPECDYNLTLGYKVRLQSERKRYFFDFDASLGASRIIAWIGAYDQEDAEAPSLFYSSDGGYTNLQASLSATFNYTVFDGWYLGAGVTPALYYIKNPNTFIKDVFKFDIMPTFRGGYDFGYMDVSFNYRHGINKDVVNDYDYTAGRLNSWQVQVFIPF